ncbi:MAG: XdhC family protein [Chloroflexi bacterium]|nr:XdhC family protein [Chloroflexota bacterium]
MEVVFREAVKVLEKGEPCVLATVIRSKGSTPQKPGAKLLVRADGSGAGTLGGGCVEGDIWFAARVLLREGGGPLVRDYLLNEELAARDGLVCGGTMYFLLQPVRSPLPFLDYAREVVAACEGGRAVAVASLIRSPEGRDLPVGTHLLLRENGERVGTLGEPSLDEAAVAKGRELMAYGKCDHITTPEGAELFVEAYTSPPTLVICGGGHISKSLAPLAKMLGFRLYIIDDRPEFVSPERFPGADGLIQALYDEGLRQAPITTNTFIVVATRGHRYDDLATAVAARSPAGYVGLVGSRRKTILIFEEMFRQGIPEERIREIHAPIGLDIGGRTPEEIAVSIMAEILMCRLGGTARPMKLGERLLLKAKEKGTEALVTR